MESESGRVVSIELLISAVATDIRLRAVWHITEQVDQVWYHPLAFISGHIFVILSDHIILQCINS